MHDTLAEYGRAVVKEMRALAAERDASATVSAAVTTGPMSGGSGDSRTGEGNDVSGTNMNSALASSGNSEDSSEKKGVGTKAKGKAKNKKQKSKVSHVVDKMLFNYRNIGTAYRVNLACSGHWYIVRCSCAFSGASSQWTATFDPFPKVA
jgi:hypothetical protein